MKDEPLLGWRRYLVSFDKLNVRVDGTREEWRSAEKTAVCTDGDILTCPMSDYQPIPDGKPRHGCGIYSFKTLTGLLQDGYASPSHGRTLYAEVVNFGRVDEFEKGYRAQHTRILRWYLITNGGDLVEPLMNLLVARFGVPIEAVSWTAFIGRFAPDWKPYADVVEWFVGTPIAFVTATNSTDLSGGLTWPTWVTASDDTTTYQNPPSPLSGSPSQHESPSPSKSTKRPLLTRIIDWAAS